MRTTATDHAGYPAQIRFADAGGPDSVSHAVAPMAALAGFAIVVIGGAAGMRAVCCVAVFSLVAILHRSLHRRSIAPDA